MKLTSLAASAALAIFAAGVSFAVACNSDDSSSTTTTQSSAASYCSALSAYVTQCKVTDPCTVASAQTCTDYVSAFSPAALTAFTACTSTLTCADAGSTATATCIGSQEANIAPSTAQLQLATDYCAACATVYPEEDAGSCAQIFYAQLTTANTDEAGSSASAADIGSAFLELNDTLVTSVDTTCAKPLGADAGPLGCIAGFEVCAGAVIDKAVKTPPACQSETPGAQ
jgi:hypothetical protein